MRCAGLLASPDGASDKHELVAYIHTESQQWYVLQRGITRYGNFIYICQDGVVCKWKLMLSWWKRQGRKVLEEKKSMCKKVHLQKEARFIQETARKPGRW